MFKYGFGVKSKVFVLFLLAFSMSQCATNRQGTTQETTGLPADIRGIKINMTKDDAHKRLDEIATSMHQAKKRQEVWLLKDDPNFSHIMLGYDRENRVRFVTTTLEKKWLKQKKRLTFAEIGDLSKAKKESIGDTHKYYWNVAENGNYPEYQVYTYGDDEEHVLHYSLAKKSDEEEEEEEEK